MITPIEYNLVHGVHDIIMIQSLMMYASIVWRRKSFQKTS